MKTIKLIPAALAAVYRAFMAVVQGGGAAAKTQGGGGSGPPTLPN